MKNAKLIGKKYQYLCNFIVDRLKRINIEENIEQKYKKSQKNDFTRFAIINDHLTYNFNSIFTYFIFYQ